MSNSSQLFNKVFSKISFSTLFKELSATSKKKLNPIGRLVKENKQIIENKFSGIVKVLPPRFYKIFALVFILAAIGYVFYLATKKKLFSKQDA